MNILYLECNMGAAGDMLTAALWELVDNKKQALEDINKIGIPHTKISFEEKISCGVRGTHTSVIIDELQEGSVHAHDFHRRVDDIFTIINSLNLPDDIKSEALDVYKIIADAESLAHNTSVNMVHFHEVGMLDAVSDIVIAAYLIRQLNIDKIICSAINTGNGNVKCSHGILPVPTPATAHILKNIPYYKSDYNCELCTPTGAALIKKFVDYFGRMPLMEVEKIGCGIGTRELGAANCVRAFLGREIIDNTVSELLCNIDDMTAEQLSFAAEKIKEQGALDVSLEAIAMKKNRSGYLLRVLCGKNESEKFIKLIFKYTSSIGIRECICSRYVLDRQIKSVHTPYGNINVKYASGYGVTKCKIEYDDIKRTADDNEMTFCEAEKILKKYI